MKYLFNKSSLLPDISNWYTNNLLSHYSLSHYLQVISNWNISNVNNINGLFSDCLSLLYFPNISKWNTNNIKKMSSLFYNCPLLK